MTPLKHAGIVLGIDFFLKKSNFSVCYLGIQFSVAYPDASQYLKTFSLKQERKRKSFSLHFFEGPGEERIEKTSPNYIGAPQLPYVSCTSSVSALSQISRQECTDSS